MRIVADTNLLVRVAIGDDPTQAELARKTLRRAELVAVPNTALCEFVWVLRRSYGAKVDDVSLALEQLLSASNIVIDHAAATSGLTMLAEGGDFADGVIEHEGRQLGGQTFVTFDRKAARLLHRAGRAVELLDPQN